MMLFPKQKNRGYTLLFAVLLSSLVLSIGISILTISRKELTLSASSRESQASFFAADTGIECTRFYLKNANALPGTINCNGYPVTTTTGAPIPNTRETGQVDEFGNPTTFPPTTVTNFEVRLGPIPTGQSQPLITEPCVKVAVRREWSNPELEDDNPANDDLSIGDRLVTTIESRGYNTCDPNDPRRTERGVRMRF